MGIMCSDVTSKGIVLFELGIADNGRSIYRISWYNGKKWGAVQYRSFNEAHATYKMLVDMG